MGSHHGPLTTAMVLENSAHFDMLLMQLMSSNNEERDHAEKLFTECKQHPDHLAHKLVTVLQSSQSVEARALAAVLLRKVLTKDDPALWTKLSQPNLEGVKAQLLQCVQKETVRNISKKVCDTVADLAAVILDQGHWPELLPFMFQCVQSGVDQLVESALLIFAELAQFVGRSLTPYIPTLHNVFQLCLSTSTSSDIRIAALRATTNFIQTVESSADRTKFQDLVPAMLQALAHALNSGEEEAAQDALEMFIELADSEPRFLRRQLQEVVAAMLSIAETESLEDGTRHLAVECLVTFAEARDKAPGMMKKVPHFADRLFRCLLMLLTDIEDDPDWHSADSEENEAAGETANHDMGQECLDRIAIAMGGDAVLPVAFHLLPQFLSHADWQKRHAGLIAIAQIAEGCAKGMVSQLEAVVTFVLNSFADAHPRVRWSAINAIGQLSTDLGPDLQMRMHEKVMPQLLHCMDDFHNPRVQAHACAAIVNFSEDSSVDVVAPYLDMLVSKLITLLQNGRRMVQEGALTALAAVADCAQGSFEKYFEAVMPFLKNILIHATDKTHRILRAKSMECISLVGMAVGKDKFRAEAKQVMDVLVSLQSTEMDDDDPTASYMLQAWARLCKCLGQEFLPYMPIVMPPLMRSVQLKPDVTITDADSDDEEDEDDEVETIRIGSKRIGIRTSVLEEKATACNMLCCYANELKEGFFPWVDEVAVIMVPFLNFYFHEEVRKAAVSVIPELLNAAKLAVEKGVAGGRDQAYVKSVVDHLVPRLVEALDKEPEDEIKYCILSSLSECATIAGTLLDPPQLVLIVEQLKGVLLASAQRKQEMAAGAHLEDLDEEERSALDAEAAEDDGLFDQVAECIGSLAKACGASFLPYFDALVPLVVPALAPSRPAEDRRIALCIIDDIFEHASGTGETAKYLGTFVPHMLQACLAEDPDVRQAAVYGVGVLAAVGGVHFQSMCADATAKLTAIIQHPAGRSRDNVMATDNAVSALGKVFEFQRAHIDAQGAMQLWLGYLPVTADKVEAKVVHEHLVAMMERRDALLLGNNHERLPRVIAVFADILAAGTELVTDPVRKRMAATLFQLQQSLSPEMQASAWSALTPHQQAALQHALSS